MRSQRVKSVVDDIFTKYDLDGNERLTKNDLLKMLQKAEVNKNSFKLLEEFQSKDELTKYDFRDFFKDLLHQNDAEE